MVRDGNLSAVDRFGLAFLFISHDLAVVDLVCDEVVVLYQGRIVERGAPQALFVRAAHPYTRALLQAVPRARPGLGRAARKTAPRTVSAGAAAAAASGVGCAFAPRCPDAGAPCLRERPLLRMLAGDAGHAAACHFAERIAAMPQND